MMGVAEELRTLAGAWDEWGLGGKLTELAERLERQRGVSDEDAEAARWVREHGGLEEVTRATRDADNRRVELCSWLGVDTTTGWSDAVAELDRRLMPPGMEWPKVDGETLDTSATYDVDGERVRIWSLGYYGNSAVQEIEVESTDGSENITSVAISAIKRTKPEPPDSWDRWREDAAKTTCKYFGRIDSYVAGCEGCSIRDCTKSAHDCRMMKAQDLERRAKALSERERGE